MWSDDPLWCSWGELVVDAYCPSYELGGPLFYSARSRGIVRTKRVVASGAVGSRDLRRVLRRNREQIVRCRLQGPGFAPQPTGDVTIRFVLGATGEVLAAGVAASSYPNASVADCMANAVRRWSFVPPSDGGVATVDATFALR